MVVKLPARTVYALWFLLATLISIPGNYALCECSMLPPEDGGIPCWLSGILFTNVFALVVILCEMSSSGGCGNDSADS